ncbi:MAG: CoB--CoM heterodisulfide reductase iron-sulfur subunit B family protein [Deltaproteobacteria bacterium]
MTDFALFLGCGIPSAENNYELATRRVLAKTGVTLSLMPGAGCCGHDLEQVDRPTFLAWAARNLCIAEQMKKDVMVLCPSCYLTLKSVNDHLKHEDRVLKHTNEMLAAVNQHFEGSVNVIHYVDFLLQDTVMEALEEQFTRSLDGLRIGVHYGCHLLRPSRVLGFDDPITPRKIDRLVELTGAQSLDYPDKTMCCGSSILGTDMRASLKIAAAKLTHVEKAGLSAMVTACPVCHMMYDANQAMISKILKEDHQVPVLHLTQLLGLAVGLNFEEVGLHMNKGNTDGIREFIG